MQAGLKNFLEWRHKMRFSYKAVNPEGKKIRGFVEANEIQDASNYLRQKELTPIEITGEKDQNLSKLFPNLNRVGKKDLVLFTRQLSSMLSSGLTLLKSLEILRGQVTNNTLREILGSVLLDVEEGRSLSSAISKYPNVFSSIYVSLVKAGESSGLLDKVFLRLATNLEKEQKLKNTVRGALIYPAIVVLLMIVVVIVMMVFVIPQINQLYEQLNAQLPLATKVVVGLSNVFIRGWIFMAAIVAVLFYAFIRWRKTSKGREAYDKLILKIPLFGKIIKESILTEFSRTFGVLIGTGTLVVDALNQSAGVTGNLTYEEAIGGVSKRVEKGMSVGEAMGYYSSFPPLLIQLVKVGEETGKIDENLMKAAEYFEEEVNQTVKNLSTVMEPFIIVVLAIGVGFLIFSIITPIYGIISQIG